MSNASVTGWGSDSPWTPETSDVSLNQIQQAVAGYTGLMSDSHVWVKGKLFTWLAPVSYWTGIILKLQAATEHEEGAPPKEEGKDPASEIYRPGIAFIASALANQGHAKEAALKLKALKGTGYYEGDGDGMMDSMIEFLTLLAKKA